MFSGRYEYTIDDKGRLSIPSKFREILLANNQGKLFVTNLIDGCLAAYPEKEWERIQESSAAVQGKENRTYLRYFFSGASECTFDRLGRILIPQSLRSYAGIKKNVVIIGNNRKLEIWAEDAWLEVVRQATGDKDKMEDIVANLDL